MIATGVNIKVISQSLDMPISGLPWILNDHLLPGMAKTAAEQFDNLLKPWPNEEIIGK
jgi:hypothetical protein